MDQALIEALMTSIDDQELSVGLAVELSKRELSTVVEVVLERGANAKPLRGRLERELWDVLHLLHRELTPEMDRDRPEVDAAYRRKHGRRPPTRDELLRPLRAANLVLTLEDAETPTRLFRIAQRLEWTHVVDLALEREADFLKRFGCGHGIWWQLCETLEHLRLQPEMSRDDELIQTALAQLGRPS